MRGNFLPQALLRKGDEGGKVHGKSQAKHQLGEMGGGCTAL